MESHLGGTYLERSEFDERLDRFGVDFPGLLHLLTTASQSGHGELVLALLEGLERGQQDSAHVFLFRLDLEPGLLDRFLHLKADVRPRGVGDFCKTEGGDLHDAAHLALGLVDAPCDLPESLRECLCFPLEEGVSRLCALQFRLHRAECHSRGKDWSSV